MKDPQLAPLASRRILVTGGGGFLGSHLLDQFGGDRLFPGRSPSSSGIRLDPPQ
jgi:hypothetical protein